jgi:hypothetical protein
MAAGSQAWQLSPQSVSRGLTWWWLVLFRLSALHGQRSAAQTIAVRCEQQQQLLMLKASAGGGASLPCCGWLTPLIHSVISWYLKVARSVLLPLTPPAVYPDYSTVLPGYYLPQCWVVGAGLCCCCSCALGLS